MQETAKCHQRQNLSAVQGGPDEEHRQQVEKPDGVVDGPQPIGPGNKSDQNTGDPTNGQPVRFTVGEKIVESAHRSARISQELIRLSHTRWLPGKWGRMASCAAVANRRCHFISPRMVSIESASSAFLSCRHLAILGKRTAIPERWRGERCIPSKASSNTSSGVTA